MKEDANDGTFLGFPLRAIDASEEDCRRTDWEAKINGRWQEINVASLGDEFHEKSAMKSIIHYLKEDCEACQKLVENWELKYAGIVHERDQLKKKLEELESDRQSQQEMAASMRNEE